MDFKQIKALADYGVDFAPTAAGMTRSTASGWQEIATNDRPTIKKWIEGDGYRSLVAVAKRGRAYMLDIDDPAACQAMGLRDEWLQDMYGVKTPSGGQHWYGSQDKAFDSLPSIVNIYEVKGDKTSKKVMEVKIDRCSVAAPTAKRVGQPGKVDGTYEPIVPVNGHFRRGLHPELLAWIKSHMETPKPSFGGKANTDWEWHPNWDEEQFLEDNDCTIWKSGMLTEGTYCIVPEACPLCGHAHNGSTIAAGVTKFLFSGSGTYGFTCKACSVDTRDEYEEKMAELDDDFDAWSQYMIYEHEDEALLAQKDSEFLKSMGVEDCTFTEVEPTAVETEKVKKPKDEFSYERHDTGNGERLVKKFGDRIRYIEETGEWAVFNPASGWQKDVEGQVFLLTKSVLNDLIDEARGKDGPAALQHALTSGRVERRKAMMKSAGMERGIHTNIWDWDSDPWMLNVANGVIDLKTLTFRERTHQDLCMKQSPVVYDPLADCPVFKKALVKYSDNDPTWVEFIQCAVGVSLTSYQGLQMVFFNQGGGENGKDAFMSLMRQMLGSYAKDVSFGTFCERKMGHSEARDDLASLAGAVRFVTSAESSDGHTLDEGAIKLVTGGTGSKVPCRHLYGKWFEYTPQFHLWFMSQYEPVIKGSDWGIWRRVVKIPWDWDFKTDPDKDPEFAEKVAAELPGILNWALEGLRKFIANGKKMPLCQRIQEATEQYKQDMDIIGRFKGDKVKFADGHKTQGKRVYEVYVEWSKANGHNAMNSRRFHGEFKKRVQGQATWHDNNKGLVYDNLTVPQPQGMEVEDAE